MKDNNEINPEDIIRKLEEIKIAIEKLEAKTDGRSKLPSPPISRN